MVTAIRVSTSGGNQSPSGTKPKAEAKSEIECPTVKAVTMTTSGRRRRNGATRQTRNRRWSVPSRMCQKPEATKRGLMPDRIERHQAGLAVELEGPNGAAGRQETQRRRHLVAEAIDARMDGELRAVGPNWIFEQHVEQLLVPVEIEVVRDARTRHMRARPRRGTERQIRRQRYARIGDPRRRQRRIVLGDRDVVDKIELGGALQGLV